MKLIVFETPSAPDEASLAFDVTLSDLSASGLRVERHDVIMDPEAIAAHSGAADLFAQEGTEALPIIAVDDVVMSFMTYPGRDELLSWFDVEPPCGQRTQKTQPAEKSHGAACAACTVKTCPARQKSDGARP
ncbi:MAG: arsenic metallochaperone ArsD family protein [Eubacteriaceae bacterium]|nr:arsenic metallochaperone ArsD family protein [Eubacteriaceae bacterium]